MMIKHFKKWKIYHRLNPQTWIAFEKITLEAVKRKRKFSARAVFDIIRWETPVSATTEEFKISNNYSPYYARLFVSKHPNHKRFFLMKEIDIPMKHFSNL